MVSQVVRSATAGRAAVGGGVEKHRRLTWEFDPDAAMDCHADQSGE